MYTTCFSNKNARSPIWRPNLNTHTQICITPERGAGLGALREEKRKAKTRHGEGR
jgi:hypothetical protein